jgi:hypothetical protein
MNMHHRDLQPADLHTEFHYRTAMTTPCTGAFGTILMDGRRDGSLWGEISHAKDGAWGEAIIIRRIMESQGFKPSEISSALARIR